MNKNTAKSNLEEKIRSLFKELARHDPFDRKKESTINIIKTRLIGISFPAVPHLIGALRRQEWPLSYHAAGILGEIGDKKAIPALVAALPYAETGEKAAKALQTFGQLAVPEIIRLIESAITPWQKEKISPKICTTHALTTLGTIRCDKSSHFLNTLLNEYMKEMPQELFDPEKYEWRFRNIDFFLLLDSMVKQQDGRAIPHIKKALDFYPKNNVENTICRIAIGRIKKKKPEGYLPMEYLDLAFPAEAILSPFKGEKFSYEDYLETNYGEYLVDDDEKNAFDSEEDDIEEEIEIEHVIGKQTLIQSLTVPRRRPCKKVYQFKLTLLGTDPPVWRRIQVPESYTFYDLHVAIQDVMAWMDYHLHHFEIPIKGQKRTRVHIECPWFTPWEMEDDWLVTTEVPIKEYLENPSDWAIYRYDYGDGWEINAILEKILPKRKNIAYPVCIDGELAAPPEDCGGIPGYYQCIKTFEAADDLDRLPDTEETEEIVEHLVWLSGWNPYLFNLQKIDFDSPRDRFKKSLK
jgi:hypothetical protein